MRRLHRDRDLPEEDIKVGLDGGRLAAPVDRELRTLAAGGDFAGADVLPHIQRLGFSEVEVVPRPGQGMVRGAGFYDGSALCGVIFFEGP